MYGLVSIIDDHTLFRQGLISLLAEFPEVDIVFDAANGEEMIEKLNKYPIPKVILIGTVFFSAALVAAVFLVIVVV